MAPMLKALSMRVSRTTGGLPTSPPNIEQAQSEPRNLETVYSDDSSVFSGLPSIQSPRDNAENQLEHVPSMDRSGHFPVLDGRKPIVTDHSANHRTESQRSRHSSVGRYKMQTTSTSESESEEERTAFLSVLRSGSTSGSESIPAGDSDLAAEGKEVRYPGTYTGVSTSTSGSERSTRRSMQHVSNSGSTCGYESSTGIELYPAGQSGSDLNYIDDNNDASTMSYESVHGVQRPRAKMNFVSEYRFPDQERAAAEEQRQQEQYDERRQDFDEGIRPDAAEQVRSPNGNEHRITEMLQAYEKQMEQNLVIIKSEDNSNSYLSELQDIIPRRVKSEDESQVLTQNQARQLRRILNQARTEVEVLKDNNEQFLSEIEQMEEENKSEKKLVEERYKQKITELKAMYQEELDNVIKEKDAAIVEAGRQTSKCLESGRKQISTLKLQIEKLREASTGLTSKQLEETVNEIKTRKDEEMTAKLGAMRESYESRLENERLEHEIASKHKVSEAVSSVTQRMLADRDREVNEKEINLRRQFQTEKMDAVHSATQTCEQELNSLRQERESVINALESVKDNVNTRYHEQMAEMREKSAHSRGPFQLLQNQDNEPKSNVEKLFKEVIEAFAFLLDASENKVASAAYLAEVEEIKKERNEVYAKARKELMMRHRAEMEQWKREQEDSKDKIVRLEESLKNLGREKRFLEDKYRRAVDSHKADLQKLRSEKDALSSLEKGRKELALAMAEGNAELAHSATSGRHHFLKTVVDSSREDVVTKADAEDGSQSQAPIDQNNVKECGSEHSRTSLNNAAQGEGRYSHLPEAIRRLRTNRQADQDGDAQSQGPEQDQSQTKETGTDSRTASNDAALAENRSERYSHLPAGLRRLRTARRAAGDTQSQAPDQDQSNVKEAESLHSRSALSDAAQEESRSDRHDNLRRFRTGRHNRKDEGAGSRNQEEQDDKPIDDPPSQIEMRKKKKTLRGSDPEAPKSDLSGLAGFRKQPNGLEKFKEPTEVKASVSESSSSHSFRSKRSILVKVRKQNREKHEAAAQETEKTRPEPTGSKDTPISSKESMKQKSFAILRNFKAAKDNSKQRDPGTSNQGKDPEGTKEHSRRARKFRSLFETLKSDDSSQHRHSIAEESLSSLQADTGASEPQSPRVTQSPKHEHSIRRRRMFPRDEAPDNQDGGEFGGPDSLPFTQSQEENSVAADDGSVRSTNRKRNPLGMFTQTKGDLDGQKKESDEKQPQKPETASKSSSAPDDLTNGTSDDGIPAPPQEGSNKPCGEEMATLKLRKSKPPTDIAWDTVCGPIQTERQNKPATHALDASIEEKDKAPLGEITNPVRNLKKPPLSSLLPGEAGNLSQEPHVLNGKKPPLPDWGVGDKQTTTARAFTPGDITDHPEKTTAFEMEDKKQVPKKIALLQGAKDQHANPVPGPHTMMCLRPLPVETPKLDTFANTSSLSDSNGLPVSSGETSETAASTDEDCLKYDTHTQTQLRNFPPLGDDESDSSGSDSDDTDRYTSLEPPVQFAKDYSKTELTGTYVPIVISRSVDESPVLYMDSNESKPIVVQGRPIYRQPELSAFSPRRDASETSSEATTAITAHTFRSSLQTEPKKKLPKSPRELLRGGTITLPPPPGDTDVNRRRSGNALSAFRARRSTSNMRRAEV